MLVGRTNYILYFKVWDGTMKKCGEFPEEHCSILETSETHTKYISAYSNLSFRKLVDKSGFPHANCYPA